MEGTGKGGKGTPATWERVSKGRKGSKADKGTGKGTKGGKAGEPKGGKGSMLADAPGTHPHAAAVGKQIIRKQTVTIPPKLVLFAAK